jgi:hypothetical protein
MSHILWSRSGALSPPPTRPGLWITPPFASAGRAGGKIRPDRPLVAPCHLPKTSRRPTGSAAWWRLAARAIAWLPTHAGGRVGQRRARLIKLLIAGAGAAAAIGSPTPLGFAIGAALAACAAGLPVARHKRRLWVQQAEDRARGPVRLEWVPAELRYDGAKLTILAEGRTWRSARTDGAEHRVVCGRHQGRDLLGWVHRHGGAAKAIWLARDQPRPSERAPAPLREAPAGAEHALPTPADTWDVLCSATSR